MRRFFIVMYYYLLKIWRKIELIFFTPSIGILVLYSILFDKEFRKYVVKGDMHGAFNFINIFDMNTGKMSSKAKHTSSIFWLIVLALILIF